MDDAVYEVDFSGEGYCRVSLFSYILGYSRRPHLRFVESQDSETMLREHIRAFEQNFRPKPTTSSDLWRSRPRLHAACR
jgi:hypothetical protein